MHNKRKLSNDIQYIEDQRSGLCFAVVNARATSQKLAITAVDCNDVEDLLSTESVVKNNTTTQSAKKVAEETTQQRNYFSIGPVFSSF